MNWRMLGPVAVAAQSFTVNGRAYSGSAGHVYDILDADADVLGANGWVKVAVSGPTTSRPTTGQAVNPNYYAAPGVRYFDTTLEKLIVFDGATWRDPTTGASV